MGTIYMVPAEIAMVPKENMIYPLTHGGAQSTVRLTKAHCLQPEETKTMTDSNFAFPIPQAVLEPYIKQAVSTAITAALGDGTELVAKAVHAALGQKVNDRGTVSQYSSDNKHNFVDVVAADAMREIARQTIKEMAEEMRPDIRKQIEVQLKKSHGKLANALVDGMIKSLETTWSVQVNFKD